MGKNVKFVRGKQSHLLCLRLTTCMNKAYRMVIMNEHPVTNEMHSVLIYILTSGCLGSQ